MGTEARASRRRGMTLVEVLVTTGILMTLSGVFFVMLLKGKTAWQASAAHAATRQDLQEVSWRISRELQGSNGTYLTDGGPSGLRAFSFVSARNRSGTFVTDDQGAPTWQEHVVYFVAPNSTRLLRKGIPRNFAASPGLLRALTLAELQAACDGEGQLVASSVKTFRVSLAPGGKVAVLEIGTEATNAQGRLDRQARRLPILLYEN